MKLAAMLFGAMVLAMPLDAAPDPKSTPAPNLDSPAKTTPLKPGAKRSGQALYYNLDCTDFFWTRDVLAGQAGDMIDKYVDEIAGCGVAVLLCNSNARRANYRSRVWDAFWDGYDPEGPDDQPFLAPVPREEVAAYRKGIGNMLKVHQQGIDYPARILQRCRARRVSPWITLRMNDCHCNEVPTHPFHGSFWRNNPQLQRKNCPGYFATCLDYAHPEVRHLYMTLIEETLDRYDIDGLELDFMREPYLFSAGEEAQGAPLLTGWLRDVRRKVDAAAARRGHPIRLGVRVPSRPETAQAMGLDAAAWAREGLIDLLVATPRWASLEFDLPIPQWRQALGKTRVTLAGGLEVLYRPFPADAPSVISHELAIGAATSVLSQGADAVYLFNYFESNFPGQAHPNLLRLLSSLDTLRKQPRRVGVTYRDITAPGEPYSPPLPATGREATFQLRLGPAPPKGWWCDVILGIAPEPETSGTPTVLVNGVPCAFLKEESSKEKPLRLLSFRVPAPALQRKELHTVGVLQKDPKPATIRQVEMRVGPSSSRMEPRTPGRL